jgi:hypothetical protein
MSGCTSLGSTIVSGNEQPPTKPTSPRQYPYQDSMLNRGLLLDPRRYTVEQLAANRSVLVRPSLNVFPCSH